MIKLKVNHSANNTHNIYDKVVVVVKRDSGSGSNSSDENNESLNKSLPNHTNIT